MSKYKHRQSHFDLRKILIGFLYLQKQLASQGIFLIKSKVSITAYLFLALNGSTALQSRSFLKNIKNFLCKQKLVNNRSISSTHAERKITVCSHKHSFTQYPSLSPYGWTDRMTDREKNTLAARGLEELFFQLCCCISILVLVGNRLWCYLRNLSTIQLWHCVGLLVLAGNNFWCYILTQCTIQLCGCVSFLVVVGNSSQNENTF